MINDEELWISGGYYQHDSSIIYRDGEITYGPDLPVGRAEHCTVMVRKGIVKTFS